VPGESVCVDCCSEFFGAALANWKPSYKIHENNVSKTHVVGGSGGLFSMSLFSASYASIQIINYIAGGNTYKAMLSRRGEYIVGKGEIEWVSIRGREGCDVCGK